jgi:HlyD family secretion protein
MELSRQLSPPAERRAAPAHRWRAGLAFGAVLAFATTAAILWWHWRAPSSVQYVTAPVTRGSVTRTVMATGTVNPELTIIVGSYVSGVIQDLYCDYNTEVKAGQICAKIDPRPYQSVVNQARANLAVAMAQLEKDQASLAYAKLSYERNSALAARQFVSQDIADNARSLYNQAQAQIGLDQATIQERQAELDTAQVNLGYTNITSPVNGTVVSRNVTRGQTVAASFQTPTLFLIATDLTRMEVDTNVSESDIGGIVAGDPATFTVDAFPKRVFHGIATQVRQSPQSVQNVITYDVVLGVDNKDLALKPGMTASTQIVIDHRDWVLRVPNQALGYAPGGLADSRPSEATKGGGEQAARLWVLRNGRATPVQVALGLDDDSFTEIVQGDLKPGDQLILGESAARSSVPLPRL